MSAKYIGKRRLYEIAKKLVKDDHFPLCKDFTYKRFKGVERIEGDDYKITSQFQGSWIKVVYVYCINDIDYERESIFAEPKDGEYEYQSARERIIGYDL